MPSVRAIYVSPGYAPPATRWQKLANRIHRLIGWPVRRTTKSRYAHAAIAADFRGRGEEIVEALAPRVRYSLATKYDVEPIRQVISVPLTDEQFARFTAAATAQVGKWYGLDDCLVGFIWHLVTWIFGEEAGNRAGAWAERVFDDRATADCSAVDTVAFQAAFPEHLPGIAPCTVSPERSRLAVLQLPGAVVEVEGDG